MAIEPQPLEIYVDRPIKRPPQSPPKPPQKPRKASIKVPWLTQVGSLQMTYCTKAGQKAQQGQKRPKQGSEYGQNSSQKDPKTFKKVQNTLS